MSKATRTAILVLLAMQSLLNARLEAQQTPPPVCELNPEFAQFDFWVGEWDVYSNDDSRTHLGTNEITKIARDCLLLEHWRADHGGRGYSMNFYDPLEEKWRQVWVANGYSIDYTGGLDEQGRMVLEGTIHYYARDVTAPFRGIWTAQADGTVRQFFEQFDAEDEAWKPWSGSNGLLYVPRDDDPLAERVRKIMQDRARAWNEGDLDRYLAHAWKSERLRYLSDDKVIRGWEAVRDSCVADHRAEKGGVLSFDEIAVEPLAEDAILVTAHWSLRHSGKPGSNRSGALTEVLRKFDGEWKATHIHMSH